jgi:hypothetical protein
VARRWLTLCVDYFEFRDVRTNREVDMSPLTIAIALLLCAFVIAVAYMAVDERA